MKGGTLLSEKIKQYLDMKRKSGLTSNTVKQYESLLNKLNKLEVEFIEDITTDGINELIYSDLFCQKKSKYGQYNQRSYLARRHYFIVVVRDFFRYSKQYKLAKWSRHIGLNYKELSPKPVDTDIIKSKLELLDDSELSDDEKQNLKFAVLFMVNTGLRANEFLSLQIKDMLKEDKINVLSKGEFEREPLVLNNTATKLLGEHIGNENNKEVYIFNLSKEKFDYWKFWYMFKKWLGFNPHRLRHTFCTRLDKMGMTPTEIQTMARHKRFETTRKYINPEKEKIEKEFRDKIKSVV